MNKINTILLRNRSNMLEEQSNSISLHIFPVVNYSKNIHATYHHQSCFKYSCECRNRLPKLPAKKTRFDTQEKNMDWSKWNGQQLKRSIFSIVNQQGDFDLFSNTYCPQSHYPI